MLDGHTDVADPIEGWADMHPDRRSMPDSTQVATLGHVRDMIAAVRESQIRIERQIEEGLDRLETDEDRRWKTQDVRSEKNERLIEQISTRVGNLENERTRVYAIYTVVRWMAGIGATILVGGFWMAWSALDIGGAMLESNAQVVKTIQQATQQRQEQNRALLGEIQDLKTHEAGSK
ncbi:hypothetical protein [Geminicoccus harenae]|uniref:hypothetical protein n=1 Tax=Geminicoccus harenae TaxID=2498453 RepID=UPI00168A99E8|nr:hypothetical protein [Geminicoccus harenae]